jgi:hypothetical protein
MEISLRDQSWLVTFEIKVNVGKHFLLTLGQVKLELLLVPALANPAHVFEWFASQ